MQLARRQADVSQVPVGLQLVDYAPTKMLNISQHAFSDLLQVWYTHENRMHLLCSTNSLVP